MQDHGKNSALTMERGTKASLPSMRLWCHLSIILFLECCNLLKRSYYHCTTLHPTDVTRHPQHHWDMLLWMLSTFITFAFLPCRIRTMRTQVHQTFLLMPVITKQIVKKQAPSPNNRTVLCFPCLVLIHATWLDLIICRVRSNKI
jgi:hypothetical protein